MCTEKNPYVFVNGVSDEKLSAFAIRRLVLRAYKIAGLDDKHYTVHTLRHTCATILFRSGIDIHTIQEILGHCSVETTEIYTHIYNKNVEDTILKHTLTQCKIENALYVK